ncbi:hypothetical protein [Pseudomonas fluorescens]|uniref:hypothetical protein n=1 Tax=Pseudomonas fluorescens TaxID=294 RepID=UPI0010E02555|nr:hypothetical protein [Pseudomonas fluorescens]TCV65730.1 hypothetical protein EDB98_108132 [Pseudomonas fluorescens]
MNKEDTVKWLDYLDRKIKATRYKLRALVYSDNSLETINHFQLNGFELTPSPLPLETSTRGDIEGLSPAFECQVISSADSHRGGNNFDIHECLDRVMPLLGFKYRLSTSYSQWEEYEGQWLEVNSFGGYVTFQNIHKELRRPDIQKIVEAYELTSTRTDKRSKKSATIRKRLKEALELEDVSKRFSFLSYYNIIEIISDDMASSKSIPSSNPVAIDISRHSLSTKGSQRTKIYFLLHAIINDFDLNDSIALADVRNDLAHGELTVSQEQLELCKKIAYWSSDNFALEVAR